MGEMGECEWEKWGSVNGRNHYEMGDWEWGLYIAAKACGAWVGEDMSNGDNKVYGENGPLKSEHLYEQQKWKEGKNRSLIMPKICSFLSLSLSLSLLT